MNRECIFERPNANEEKKESIFIIAPFGFPYDDLYELGIKENFCPKKNAKTATGLSKRLNVYKEDVMRADQSLQLGYVMCHRICQNIKKATYIYADISEANGNVFYELGLAYGLGRQIGLLKNDKSNNQCENIFEDLGATISRYKKLTDLRDEEFLLKSIENGLNNKKKDSSKNGVSVNNAIADNNNGDPLIIHNFVNTDGQSMDLHHYAIDHAIEKLRKDLSKGWMLESFDVNSEMHIKDMCTNVTDSKICVFDMTHYQDPVNVYMFFLLGFAHAKEKAAIPLINRKKNMSMPFDVGGLWQVYYDKNEELTKGLYDIIENMGPEIEKEKTEQNYKDIWDRFLKRKNLEVFTCARPGKPEESKIRTHIDKWDYMAVNELTLMIGRMYKSSEVTTAEPMNKKEAKDIEGHNNDTSNELLKKIQDQIQEHIMGKSCVIVGSPDVSDYAEIVLAKIHNIPPYRPNDDVKSLAFLFYKNSKDKTDEKTKENIKNPRRLSSFYSEPCDASNNKEGVHFNTFHELEEPKENPDNSGKETIIGKTCIVITIAKNPFPSPNGEFDNVMVLSGFTGVGTYGAIKLFTEPAKKLDHKEDAKSKEDSEKAKNYIEELKKYLQGIDKIKNDENIVGWNTLLMVTYTSDQNKPGDPRELTSIEYIGTKKIPKQL